MSSKLKTAVTVAGIVALGAVGVSLLPGASEYVIPDCRVADGGWDDARGPVDCLKVETAPNGKTAPRWAGCNVVLRKQSVGSACLDVPSGVVEAGKRIEDTVGR